MKLVKINGILIKDKDYKPIKLMPVEVEYEPISGKEYHADAMEFSLKVLQELGFIITIPESKYRELYKKSFTKIKEDNNETTNA